MPSNETRYDRHEPIDEPWRACSTSCHEGLRGSCRVFRAAGFLAEDALPGAMLQDPFREWATATTTVVLAVLTRRRRRGGTPEAAGGTTRLCLCRPLKPGGRAYYAPTSNRTSPASRITMPSPARSGAAPPPTHPSHRNNRRAAVSHGGASDRATYHEGDERHRRLPHDEAATPHCRAAWAVIEMVFRLSSGFSHYRVSTLGSRKYRMRFILQAKSVFLSTRE